MFEGWGAAVVGAAVVGGVASNMAASKGAKAQSDASKAGIESENYRFDKMQEMLKPYTAAGEKSLASQGDLAGLNGPEAQQAAVAAIEKSPEFGAMTQQGEEAILQNASATGGVRGGNTQGALATFRPQLLSGLIDKQYNRLGGITQIGQASAAGVGSAGITTGSNIANLLAQQGQAEAGKAIAQGQAVGNVANSIATAAILSNMNSNGGGKVF
jgi:hypothetical protein